MRSQYSYVRLATLMAAACALASSWNPALGLPLATQNGNPIENLLYFPTGFVGPISGRQYPAGYAKETGANPANVTQYVEHPQLTAQQVQDINDYVTTNHPNVTRVANPTNEYDCHGLTFKNGALWINNDQVQRILDDQGWMVAPAGMQNVGDIVVYKKDGKITHTGLVQQSQNGNATKIDSKWGAMGRYIHDPTDVPNSYGTPTIYKGGAALADPPLNDEDVDVFHGILPPPLKPALWDPSVTGFPATAFDDYPIPELKCQPSTGNEFHYGLDIPELGLTIAPGDELKLYGEGLVSAAVGGLASSPSFGGWAFSSLSGDVATFVAQDSAFVPFDAVALIDGFSITSVYSQMGDLIYTESVAGSVGRTCGPVPEPASMMLLLVAAAALRRCTR